MGTMIIKNRQFRSKFLAKFTDPKGETLLKYPQNGQYLSAVLKLVTI